MNTFYTQLGGLFAALTALFALGILPRFSRRFYPETPRFLHRVAAPAIFAALAMACFLEMGKQALVMVVIFGVTQIVANRRYGIKSR